ncbi:MAG: hypothetical protein HY298_06655 [Verrucomicrobia bacterium]|nr:hypothetical protein [Verrucomicrobiota bacterium]
MGVNTAQPKKFWLRFWLYVLPVLWMLWLGLAYAYCIRVWLRLGYWPILIEDHAGLKHGAHWAAAFYSWFLLLLLLIAWTLVTLGSLPFIRRLRTVETFVGLILSWLPALYAVLIDPGGRLSWLID